MRRRQRSDLSLAQGESIHVEAKPVPFMVRPGSRYRIWWDVTTAILLVYVAVAEPFVVAGAGAGGSRRPRQSFGDGGGRLFRVRGAALARGVADDVPELFYWLVAVTIL